jgi:hypothetical protein
MEVPNIDDLQLQRGDIVTVSYENFSRRAIPVNPKLVRIRKDVSWEEVLQSYTDEFDLNGNLFYFLVFYALLSSIPNVSCLFNIT